MLNASVHVHDLQLYLTKNKNKNIVKAIWAVILKKKLHVFCCKNPIKINSACN